MRGTSLLLAGLAVTALAGSAVAEPVKLSKQQMEQVVAGSNPNIAPNGTNVNSNGASGAPGNSFHPGK